MRTESNRETLKELAEQTGTRFILPLFVDLHASRRRPSAALADTLAFLSQPGPIGN